MTTIRRVRRVGDVGGGVTSSSPPKISSNVKSSSSMSCRTDGGNAAASVGGGGGRRGDDVVPGPLVAGRATVGMGGGSSSPPTAANTTSLSEKLRLLNESENQERDEMNKTRMGGSRSRRGGPMLDADHPGNTTTPKSLSRINSRNKRTTDNNETTSSYHADDAISTNSGGGWSWASSAMNSVALGSRAHSSYSSSSNKKKEERGHPIEEEGDSTDMTPDEDERKRIRRTSRLSLLIEGIIAGRKRMTTKIGGMALLLLLVAVTVIAGGVVRDRRRNHITDRQNNNDRDGSFVDDSSEYVGTMSISSLSISSKKMMPSSSSLLPSMNDKQQPQMLRGRTDIPSKTEGDEKMSTKRQQHDDDILPQSPLTYSSSYSFDDYLAHLTNMTHPYDADVETPYFWDVHFSGESIAERVFGLCHDLVMASEFGLRQPDYDEDKLDTFVLDDVRYVNVDTTTDDGIERASNLDLANSRLADVIISPRFRDVSSRIFTTSSPGRMFAIFRHPVERAVDMYRYLSMASWDPMYNPTLSSMTIEQYANSGYIENNWVTRFLVNKRGGKLDKEDMALAKYIIKTKCLVGLYEDMDVTLARFVRYFGWGKPMNSTAIRNEYDVDGCRSDVVSRGDRHISGGKQPDDDNRKVVAPVRPGSLAWDAIVRMNMFDMELYEYARRVYQAQAEEIYDVVGYELPVPVVASAPADDARPKSMNDETFLKSSSRSGTGMEINSSNEDNVVVGGIEIGDNTATSDLDMLEGSDERMSVDALKSMAEDAGLGTVKGMDAIGEGGGGWESEISAAGNKVMGDDVKIEPVALRMADLFDPESESTPTAILKKMSVDGD